MLCEKMQSASRQSPIAKQFDNRPVDQCSQRHLGSIHRLVEKMQQMGEGAGIEHAEYIFFGTTDVKT